MPPWRGTGESEGTPVTTYITAGGRPHARQRVGRPELPLDPGDGPLQEFALALRQSRAAAGYPSYRALASTALFSASVLSCAASGMAFPTLPVTLAYARACGGDISEWRDRWESTAIELATLGHYRQATPLSDSRRQPILGAVEGVTPTWSDRWPAGIASPTPFAGSMPSPAVTGEAQWQGAAGGGCLGVA